MSGSIQSIERATAILDLLEQCGRPLQLGEIAEELQMSKPTVHGIVRTLLTLEYIDQDAETGSYEPGARLAGGSVAELDGNDVRSKSMSWADTLAAVTGAEVVMAVLRAPDAEIVHHVYRPDDSSQRLRVGELIPLHATACGKLVLAHSPTRARLLRNVELHRFTTRTTTDRSALTRELETIRRSGVAIARTEYEPTLTGVAVPVRGPHRTGVAAMAVLGAAEEILDGSGKPHDRILAELRRAAAAVTKSLASVG